MAGGGKGRAAGRDALRRALQVDHDEVIGLFERLGDPELADVAATWRRLRDVLRVHARAEEALVYARLADDPRAQEQVGRARACQAEIDRLVDEADAAPPGGDPFHERLGELHAVVTHHASEDELLIAQAARLLSEAEREVLAARLGEVEELLLPERGKSAA